ncbi:hypothetical protein [Caldimonas sp. KR1-144]|uniref:hypothetical protein n=1 Tax=Caldimonas sp. KR1-144 TaxID=3400911 RepID=UPI003C003D1C
MTAFNYAATAQTAQRLLQRFGAQTTLTRPGTPTYDPETGETTATPVVDSCTAAVFPYGDKYVDGTQILATDRQAYIAAVGLTEPKPGDVLLWGGSGLTVIKTKNIAPAGLPVLYEAQVRA